MGIRIVDDDNINLKSKIGYFCILGGEPCPIIASIKFTTKNTWNTAIGSGYYAVMLGNGRVSLVGHDVAVYKYNDITYIKWFPSYVDENGLKEEYRSDAVYRVKELIKNIYRQKLENLILPSMKYPEYEMWSEFFKDFIRNPEKCIIEIVQESS
jgi:hypothetical protein